MSITKGDILTDYSNVEVEVRAVASGGFGLVAFGPDRLGKRMRALKTIRPDVLRRGGHIREMFIREGLTWVGVWPHANVMTAHFVTEINSMPFLVLNYAEQGSLRRHLRPGLPAEQALTWAQHIAAGMTHLHTTDPEYLRPDPIVHRDLKPDNILIQVLFGAPFACITDFGLAKTQAAVAQAEAMADGNEEEGTAQDNTRSQHYRTGRGVSMGTPAYMAPEQWADAASAGPAADVYAFGLILGELLTGQHPLLPLDERHTQQEWLAVHLAGQHRPLPSVFPLPLQHLYNDMLALDPAQRPTMAETFAQLQTAARRLGLYVYAVPDVFPLTTKNQADFWQSWADAHDRFGLYAEALVRSDHAYALAPQYPYVLSSRADILAHLGRMDDALTLYTAAFASLLPDDKQGRKIVLNQQGLLFKNSQRFAEADATYAAALREMPAAADTWYNRGNNLRLWGEHAITTGERQQSRDRFRQAFDCARESWRLNSQDQGTPGLLARIGARLNESQMYAEAEEAYALALSSEVGQENTATWYNRALNLLQWGRGEVQAGQVPEGHAHLRAALAHAQEAQRRGLDAPQLPTLIAQIQAAQQQA